MATGRHGISAISIWVQMRIQELSWSKYAGFLGGFSGIQMEQIMSLDL